MPLPSKQPKENRKEFIDRCISDPKMREEFKDIKQRIAVCLSQLKKKK